MEKYSSLTGTHRRRAISKARRLRRKRRRAAAVVCGVTACCLVLALAVPSFRHRSAPFVDGKAEAKSFDGGVWEDSATNLPFIRFGKTGWVLSDPAPYETVSICAVEQRRFRCLLKEKEEYAAELLDIARELTFVPR